MNSKSFVPLRAVFSGATGLVKTPLAGAFALFLLVSCAALPHSDTALSRDEALRLAGIYESQSDYVLAARYYQQGLSGGGTADDYLRAANLYLKMKNYDEAQRYYRKIIDMDPDDARALNNLGWLYLEKNEPGKAIELALRAVKKGGRLKFVYLDTLGVIEFRLKHYPESESALNEALSLAPDGEKAGRREINLHLLDLYRQTDDKEKEARVRSALKALE